MMTPLDFHITSLSTTITILTCYLYLLKKKKRRRRIQKRRSRSTYFFRTRETLQNIVSLYTEDSFRMAARMSKETFWDLLDVLSPFLRKNEHMATIGSAGVITPGIRLLTTLRVLAGASPRDLSVLFRISLPAVYCVFHETIGVINDLFPLPGIPTDERELRKMALEFSLSRHCTLGVPSSPLPGCIATIDGLTVTITKPDVPNPSDYVNRYSKFSFPVTATVGPRYQFLTTSAIATGSSHDSTAFQLSNIGQFVEEGGVPPGYWISGDDAYGLSETIITPIPMSDIDVWQHSLNYYLSSLRVHVEQAFGMLRMKFCILYRPLRFRLRRSVRVVSAAMTLHNLCIEKEGWYFQKDLEALSVREVANAAEELDLWLEESKLAIEMELRNDRSTKSRTRDRMLEIIKLKDLLRPNDM